MDRMIAPTLRRLPAISISSRRSTSISVSATAASAVSFSNNAKSQARFEDSWRPNRLQINAKDGGGGSDDASVRLWSALEESELPSNITQQVTSSTKPTSTMASDRMDGGDEVKFNFERASNIVELDRRWREFRSSNSDKDVPVALIRRSLAISRVVLSSPTQSKRALGAFFRVLNNNSNATNEEIQSVLNATCETLLRSDGGGRVLDLIQLVRKQKGHPEVFNKRTYALAIAASLALGPTTTITAANDSRRLVKKDGIDQQQEEQQQDLKSKTNSRINQQMDEVSESALKSSLRYFKSLFNSFSSSSTTPSSDISVELQQLPPPINEMEEKDENKWSTFAVLDMMKRDFSEFNYKDANLTQDLFDDVLVLSPSKASQIAEAMQSSGFSPSPTSFLAMLHGAMKAADASRALSLLNEMHSNGVQRNETHYIATATALARRSQKERWRAGVPHPIRPWYFTALLEEYEKDFVSSSSSINGEFANALTIGMCAIRLGDQELIPVLENLTIKLKDRQARISGEGYGSLLTRLSVTHGEENAKRILEWMKQVDATRDKHVNNGFICFYGECLVKNSRAIRRLEQLKANDAVIAKKKRESESILNLSERLCAEMIQQNMTRLPLTSALLQRRIAKHVRLDNEFSNLINAFDVPSEEQLRPKPTLDQRTFELLARAYVYSSHGEVLEELITSLAKDAAKWVDCSPLYVLLVEAYGLAGKVDKAVEIVAEMQSQGMTITADLVEALVGDVFVRNGRVGEGLAHALGLCRTYKVSPHPTTALKMLKGARKDGDEEEETRVLAFFKEFGLEGELVARKSGTSSSNTSQRK